MAAPIAKSFLFVLLFISFNLKAQQFYTRLSLGYGFPSSAEYIGTNSSFIVNTYTNPGSDVEFPHINTSEKNIYGSLGAGKNLQLSAGFMLNDNMGVEAMVGYFVGNDYSTRNINRESRLDILISEYRTTKNYHSWGFTFSPMFKLSLSQSSLVPYIMVGPLLGKVNLTEEWATAQQDEGVLSSEETKIEYEGGISIGSRAIVGVEWKTRDRISFFMDVSLSQLNFYPTSSIITSYKVNGEDHLDNLSLGNRKTVYRKAVVYDSEESSTADSPTQSARINYAMNSLSVNLGIKFLF